MLFACLYWKVFSFDLHETLLIWDPIKLSLRRTRIRKIINYTYKLKPIDIGNAFIAVCVLN